jgi:AcrR family transcriptional regulator
MFHVMEIEPEREPECPTGPELPVVQLELPVVEEAPRERADAARNRVKVLAAAEELFARHGPECVSMEAIATAAGVGKGTLFRRFGDRAGLARALLDERERRLQEAMIRGAPPLGPGAPPRERLIAFGRAILDFPDDHRAILVAADSSGARYRHPAYSAWRTHVALLLREGDPELDADLVADFLLATLRADLVSYLREGGGMEPERIADGWRALVERLLPG